MSDITLNRYLIEGTNAQRLLFTPDPTDQTTIGPGLFSLPIWYETDTGDIYIWDQNGTAWVLVVSGGGGGGITDLTGDVTATGPGSVAATIANSAVTYAKIQNVSTTSRILARKTAGAGVVEEATLSEILDFIGSAAQGDILYRDAASWARLAAGTAGQVLQTGGVGANPSWVTPSSAFNAAWAQVTTDESTSSTSYTDLATAGPSVTVTTGTSVVVIWILGCYKSGTGNTALVAPDVSGATTIAASDTNSSSVASSFSNGFMTQGRILPMTVTAGSNTFKLQYRVDGSTWHFAKRGLIVIY